MQAFNRAFGGRNGNSPIAPIACNVNIFQRTNNHTSLPSQPHRKFVLNQNNEWPKDAESSTHLVDKAEKIVEVRHLFQEAANNQNAERLQNNSGGAHFAAHCKCMSKCEAHPVKAMAIHVISVKRKSTTKMPKISRRHMKMVTSNCRTRVAPVPTR